MFGCMLVAPGSICWLQASRLFYARSVRFLMSLDEDPESVQESTDRRKRFKALRSQADEEASLPIAGKLCDGFQSLGVFFPGHLCI